jgi:uncharacterized membrane protein (UPF0127 family)
MIARATRLGGSTSRIGFVLVVATLLAAACFPNGAPNGAATAVPAEPTPFGNLRIFTAEGKTVYLQAEIADTPEKQSKGLSNLQSLPENSGMLFVFAMESIIPFWMKDTFIPLSIAFIGKDGVIHEIQDMQPQTLDYHLAQAPFLYALEVNQGWFQRHNVKPGDRVEFDRPSR